jgi:hypothetical protein
MAFWKSAVIDYHHQMDPGICHAGYMRYSLFAEGQIMSDPGMKSKDGENLPK